MDKKRPWYVWVAMVLLVLVIGTISCTSSESQAGSDQCTPVPGTYAQKCPTEQSPGATDEPAPLTPTDIPEVVPTPTGTPVPPYQQPIMESTPTSPTLPPNIAKDVLFLLDNSKSITEFCPNSDNRSIRQSFPTTMVHMTQFVIDLMSASRDETQNSEQVQMGVYALLAKEESSHEVVSLRPVDDFRDDPNWWQPIESALESPIDDAGFHDALRWIGGFDDRWEPLESDAGVLQKGRDQALIILTDGYFGARDYLYDETTNALSAIKKEYPRTSIHLVLFKCSNQIQDLHYQDDLEYWVELDDPEDEIASSAPPVIDKIWEVQPETASASSDPQATSPSRVVQELIEHPLFSTIWPTRLATSDHSGRGWLNGGVLLKTITLPGNVLSLDFSLVVFGDGSTFDITLNRENQRTRSQMQLRDYHNLYTTRDDALVGLLTNPTESCGDITMELRGPTRSDGLAYFWWSIEEAEFEIESVNVRPSEIVNNSPFSVRFDIDGTYKESLLDCYMVRVIAYTGDANSMTDNPIIDMRMIPFSNLDRHLSTSVPFSDYRLVAKDGSKINIAVEILKCVGGNASTPKDCRRLVLVDTEESYLEAHFRPSFAGGKINCNADSDQCTIEISLDYATENYHEGEVNPDVYLLSELSPEKYRDSELDCEDYSAQLRVQDGLYKSARRVELNAEGANDKMRWEEQESQVESNSRVLIVTIDPQKKADGQDSVNPRDKLDACGYRGVLIQWSKRPQDWPAFLCTIHPSPGRHVCLETEIRVGPN